MPVRAAGIAYYAVFSIIPGFILAFAIYGLIVGTDEAARIISQGFAEALRMDPGVLEAQLKATFQGGGGASLVSLLLLLFGTRGLLKSLYRGISVSFGEQLQNVKVYNLRSLLILGIASVAILLAAVWGPITGLLLSLLSSVFGPVEPIQRAFEILSSFVAPAVLAFALFLLYRVLPMPHPTNRDALIGAVVATLGFIALRFGYNIYLGFFAGGVAGAFAEFLGLLLFLAFTADVVLFGAEVAGRSFPVWADDRSVPDAGSVLGVRSSTV